MAFEAVFYALTPSDLERLIADPAIAAALFAEDEPPVTPSDTLDIGNHWHGVHYLLCGQPKVGREGLSRAVLGGLPIGDDPAGFTGFGPARYFPADMVAELSQGMGDPQVEVKARGRFSPDAMNRQRIHPSWRLADGPGLIDSLRKLRAFYEAAATRGDAIVTCVLPV